MQFLEFNIFFRTICMVLNPMGVWIKNMLINFLLFPNKSETGL